MSIKIINQLINGTYIAEGKVISVPVKSVHIEADLVKNIGDLIAECGLQGKAFLVCDANTYIAAAEKIGKILALQDANILVFDSGVKADIENVERIKSLANSCDYIIAVGSGTINDLCKYASFLLGLPYIICGTAPSMNGYSSANASITYHGYKKTIAAHLPLGIFLDLDVLIKAPIRLIRSGLGDSVCRSTAQADWLLSHLVLDTFYSDLPFLLLRGSEASLFDNSKGLVNGDKEVMALLAQILVLSGFGMYLAGGSYPASQGEHMISHTMEMVYGKKLPDSYHGEQIGVTTLTMAKIQEEVVSASAPTLQNELFPDLSDLFDINILQECAASYAEKQFSKEQFYNITLRINNNWQNIRQAIKSIMLPYDMILKTLKNAGCPLSAQDIGWKEAHYKQAAHYAKFTRGRFTFLDLINS